MKVQFTNWIFISYLFIVFVCVVEKTKADEDEKEDVGYKNGRFRELLFIDNYYSYIYTPFCVMPVFHPKLHLNFSFHV